MSEVAFICQPKNEPYTKEQVMSLLPLLDGMCTKYNKQQKKIRDDQYFYIKSGAPQSVITACDDKIGKIMSTLFTKIGKLGGRALGNGWVAWDNGTGYYCWRYSEPNLLWIVGYGVDPALFRRPA